MSIEEEDVWVYDAIMDAQGHLGILQALTESEHQVPQDSVDSFVSEALDEIGFSSPERPGIAFDIPDGALIAGSYSETEGLIHLQPSGLDRWIILHEVAHWMTPGDRHRDAWRGRFTDLVRASLGDDEADELTLSFDLWRPIVPGNGQLRRAPKNFDI